MKNFEVIMKSTVHCKVAKLTTSETFLPQNKHVIDLDVLFFTIHAQVST